MLTISPYKLVSTSVEFENFCIKGSQCLLEPWIITKGVTETLEPWQRAGDAAVGPNNRVESVDILGCDSQDESDGRPNPWQVWCSVAKSIHDLGIVLECSEQGHKTTHVPERLSCRKSVLNVQCFLPDALQSGRVKVFGVLSRDCFLELFKSLVHSLPYLDRRRFAKRHVQRTARKVFDRGPSRACCVLGRIRRRGERSGSVFINQTPLR